MRQKEINSEWLYSAVCAVIFLPRAARLVNNRNLSMSAVCRNVSARNECLSPSFILQPHLYSGKVWLFLWQKARYAAVFCLTRCYHSRLPHTSCFDQWKRMTLRLTNTSLQGLSQGDLKGLERYLSCLINSTTSISGASYGNYGKEIWPEGEKLPFILTSFTKFSKMVFQSFYVCIYKKFIVVGIFQYETLKKWIVWCNRVQVLENIYITQNNHVPIWTSMNYEVSMVKRVPVPSLAPCGK